MVKITDTMAAASGDGEMKRKRIWIPALIVLVMAIALMGSVALAVTNIEGFNDTLQGILSSQSETNSALLRLFEMILP